MPLSSELLDIIRNEEHFYHATYEELYPSIMEHGLCPVRATAISDGLYTETEHRDRDLLFIATHNGRDGAYNMKLDLLEEKYPIMLQIDAAYVRGLNLELDTTFEQIATELGDRDKNDPLVFSELLGKYGCLICLNRIPPEYITRIDYTHPDGNRGIAPDYI